MQQYNKKHKNSKIVSFFLITILAIGVYSISQIESAESLIKWGKKQQCDFSGTEIGFYISSKCCITYTDTKTGKSGKACETCTQWVGEAKVCKTSGGPKKSEAVGNIPDHSTNSQGAVNKQQENEDKNADHSNPYVIDTNVQDEKKREDTAGPKSKTGNTSPILQLNPIDEKQTGNESNDNSN